MLGVPAERVFQTLGVYLGSSYVNDFNYLGRTFRVQAQADGGFRQSVRDIARLKTRNDAGEMVPIGSIATFRDESGRLLLSAPRSRRSASSSGATTRTSSPATPDQTQIDTPTRPSAPNSTPSRFSGSRT